MEHKEEDIIRGKTVPESIMNNKQNKELLIQTISLTNNLNLLETTEQQTAKWSWGKSEAFFSQLECCKIYEDARLNA